MIDLPPDPDVDTALTAADLTDAEVATLDAAPHAIVLTPFRRREDGAGVYDTAPTFAVKELRAGGLDIGFLDPPERRVFDVRKSAVADLVQIGLSIPGTLVANSLWWQLERILEGRFGGDTATKRLKITVIDPQSGQKFVIEGSPADVTRAATELAAQNPPSGSGNPNPPSGP